MPRGRFVFAAILILARTALAQGGVAQGSDDVEEGPVESPSRLDNQVIDSAQLHLVPYGRDTRDVESAALSAPRVQRDPFGLRILGASSPETNLFIDGLRVDSPAFGLPGKIGRAHV